VILSFTPIVRSGYRIGVPCGGEYIELLNSDSTFYGGSNVGNSGALRSTPTPWMGLPCSLSLTLPPLAALVLQPK
jgi:1,4-alpha-glucan branching enzyme